MSDRIIRLPMTAGNMLASLEGRKTQTRRIMRPQLTKWEYREDSKELFYSFGGHHKGVSCASVGPFDDRSAAMAYFAQTHSPYGWSGAKLALTESWRPLDVRNIRRQQKALIEYRADGKRLWQVVPDLDAREKIERAMKHGNWMPPMFQQVWSSRAPAVNAGVRVERVQKITRQDAAAEGVCGASFPGYQKTNWPEENFRVLWDSINGDRDGGAWMCNPWVWVVDYELTNGGRKEA